MLYARRRALGVVVLLAALATLLAALWWLPHDLRAALELAVDPVRARRSAVLLGVVLALWTVVVVLTFLMVRPVPVPRWKTGLGSAFVAGLCLAVAAPVAVASRYAMVQADLVDTVFGSSASDTAPRGVTTADPWAGRDRLTVLLLGGDGGEGRIGVRTDSMILMSTDVRTGRTVTFSLPRNMMNAQFPEGSPLHQLYPYGFTGAGDPGSWMLNAVYREVPLLHPDLFPSSDNPGADALKLAVEGSTGLPVDYYLLVNLKGFQSLVDAMGGVTVNINTPVAVGGNTDAGVPPDYYLQPGPDQHLDGFHALWFARGRYGADDYQRMERQRCMVDAIVEQASPWNVLRRFEAVASASKELIYTDIPQRLLAPLVELALEVKDQRVKSVVFRSSDQFNPGDPDFDQLQDTVAAALEPRPHRAGGTPHPAEDSATACAYTGPTT